MLPWGPDVFPAAVRTASVQLLPTVGSRGPRAPSASHVGRSALNPSAAWAGRQRRRFDAPGGQRLSDGARRRCDTRVLQRAVRQHVVRTFLLVSAGDVAAPTTEIVAAP